MYKSLNSWLARMDLKTRAFYLAIFAVLTLTGCAHELVAHEAVNNSLKIVQKREGDSTRFFVNNLEQTEVTVTFEMDLTNLKGNIPFPYTMTVPGSKLTEAFLVNPIQKGEHSNYSYTSHYTIGSTVADHDDSYVY